MITIDSNRTISRAAYLAAVAQLAQHVGLDPKQLARIECEHGSYTVHAYVLNDDGRPTGDQLVRTVHVVDIGADENVPSHAADCAIVTTHHLTCTCGSVTTTTPGERLLIEAREDRERPEPVCSCPHDSDLRCIGWDPDCPAHRSYGAGSPGPFIITAPDVPWWRRLLRRWLG